MGTFLHLPSEIPAQDIASIILHTAVNFVAITENIMLFFAIIFRTPSSQRSYSVILVNCVFIDLIAALSSFLAMTRLIAVGNMVAYAYDGPCVIISGFFCHATLTVTLATTSQSIFLIATSFGYRLYSLERETPRSWQVLLVCILISIPNLIVLPTFMFSLDDTAEVRKALAILRPDYDLSDYEVEGQLDIFKPSVMFTILAMTMPIGPLLMATFVLRGKVLARIQEKSSQMSVRTSKIHSAFTKVLSLQALLPVFFLVSVICYLSCQTDTVCYPAMEHMISEAASIVPLLSPAITLYFVQPYRAFVEEKVCCKEKQLNARMDSNADYSARKISTF